jgi:hypothetical protein
MDEEQEYTTPPPEVRIPNAWRAMASLSEALTMLSANPDLMGPDIELALESEAPDALAFLDALIADRQHGRYIAEADKRYADLVARRAKDAAARVDRKDAMIVQVMQRLALKTRRAAAGTAFWSNRTGGVNITDDTLIPEKYKTARPVEYSIDKKAIGRDLDNSIEVPGAMRGNGSVSLTIKG